MFDLIQVYSVRFQYGHVLFCFSLNIDIILAKVISARFGSIWVYLGLDLTWVGLVWIWLGLFSLSHLVQVSFSRSKNEVVL